MVVNLDKRDRLATVRGPLSNTQEKNLKNDGECGCRWLNSNPQSPENNPKNTQNQQTTENERMLKPKYKLSGRLDFTLSLPGGQFARLSPVSYATGYDILYLHTVSCPYSTATRYQLVA